MKTQILSGLAFFMAALPATAHLKEGSLKPSGTESFQVNNTMTIEWVATQAHDGRYDIYFSKDGGKTYPLEMAGPWQGSKTDGGKNTYLWKIPTDAVTAQGRIRICQLSGGHCVQPGVYTMESPANFTITAAGTDITPDNQIPNHESGLDLLAENGKLDIRFRLDQAQNVSLKAYDATGTWVATLFQGAKEKGEHRVTAITNGSDLKGPLVFKLQIGENQVLSQMWQGF